MSKKIKINREGYSALCKHLGLDKKTGYSVTAQVLLGRYNYPFSKSLSIQNAANIIKYYVNKIIFEREDIKTVGGNISITKIAAKESAPKQDNGYTEYKKKSDEFLKSFAWRKLRFEAITKYGKRCQCCGAVPDKDNDIYVTVDHIKPRKFYPELALDINNLQVLCNKCNHGKGNLSEQDFRDSEK